MSLDIDDSGVFSRLQLARALKEDLDNPSADPPENSAIFLRQRARKSGSPAGQFYIPRPTSLLTPPILNTIEPQNNDPQHLQGERRSSTHPPNIITRGSVVAPPSHETRRGSAGKPTTLLDVRKSILDTRQSIHNMLPFSPASSQRTSQILHQHKSLPDLSPNSPNSPNKQSHGASRLSTVSTNTSRKNSTSTIPSRPTSSINPASRPNSMFKSNKSFIPQDSEDSSSSSSDSHQRSSPKSLKSKSKKSVLSKPSKSKHKKAVGSDDELSEEEPTGGQSSTNKSTKKHKNTSKGKLEKVEEEDSDDSEETDDEEEDDADDDESESEEDDIPLALKNTPKIRVAAPNGNVKKNGGRIEAWLDTVSVPEPDNARQRRPPSGYMQTPPSPLGLGYRSSLTPEPGNHRPRSSTENIHPPDRSQPRKRANSEYVPKRNSHMPEPQFMQVGRISPSPRQDSGYWARDTLAALSGDARHLSLINDSSSNFTSNSNSQTRSDSVGSARHQHQRESSGSSFGSRPHSPQVPSPTLKYSRSRDSLNASTNSRQSYYKANDNVRRVGSDHIAAAANRVSYYQPSQQKHKVR